MKNFLYPTLRCVCVLLVGVLLVVYRSEWAQMLIVLAGAVFFVCGLVSVIVWLVRKGQDEPFEPKVISLADDDTQGKPLEPSARKRRGVPFPLLGIGSALLGLLLMVGSKGFVSVFVYVVGAALVLLSIYQLVALSRIHHEVRIPGWLFVVPVASILFGLLALWNPGMAVSLPFLLVGVGCIVSGVGDAIALLMYAVKRKKA